MNEVEVFNFEANEVRTVIIENEAWFVGKDIADTLGYSASRNALSKHVDNDEKLTHQISASGQKREMVLINESGVYSLIFGSKLESAKRFKKWVTSEVLPAIRKTGIYSSQPQLPSNPHDVIQALLVASNDDHKTLVNVDERVTDLEVNAPLSTGEYNYISKRINQRVSQSAKDFGGNLTAKQRGELFKDINNGVKTIAGIDTRTQLRNRHYQDVVAFINDWEPSTATKTVIRQMTLNLDQPA